MKPAPAGFLLFKISLYNAYLRSVLYYGLSSLFRGLQKV